MKIGNLSITVIVLCAIGIAFEGELLGRGDPIPLTLDLPSVSTVVAVMSAPVQNPVICPPGTPPGSPAKKRFRINQPSTTK